MRRYIIVASLFIAAFIITTVGSVGNVDAQKGSRLCGISIGPVGFLVEFKQPSGKRSRRDADKYCDKITKKILTDLKGKSVSTEGYVNYKRAECQKVARTMSGGKSSYDICKKMRRFPAHDYSWRLSRLPDPDGLNPMSEITYEGGNKFKVEEGRYPPFNKPTYSIPIPLNKHTLRHKNKCPQCDLSGVNLEKANLTGAKLYGADLSGAKLRDAKLSGATWTDGRQCANGSIEKCK